MTDLFTTVQNELRDNVEEMIYVLETYAGDNYYGSEYHYAIGAKEAYFEALDILERNYALQVQEQD